MSGRSLSENKQRTYFCIDLKTFYASVECVIRQLNPFSTDLVVADPSRGKGAICLAVSPHLKELGVRNRCRLYEIPDSIAYLTALPRMSLYIRYSARIYGIYLRFVAKEDIHVYSIDEAFLDVTDYLRLYRLSPELLAEKIMKTVLEETGIPSACGIGTNLYLAKVALDILAKHRENGIAVLDETRYREQLGRHRPLTDFWQIGSGIARRLESHGFYYLEDVVEADPRILYGLFGVNAEYLIDHARGVEPCTIEDIHNYKVESRSVSSGQVLFEDYDFEKAELVVKEMVELACLDLSERHLVASGIGLSVGYSKERIPRSGGSAKLTNTTNSFRLLLPRFLELYRKTTKRETPIRKITVFFSDVKDELCEQYDLFIDREEARKDVRLQKTLVKIKKKYGKSAVMRGMNLEKGATTPKRNKLIGGHNGE